MPALLASYATRMHLLTRIALFLGESSGRIGGAANRTRDPGFGRGGEAAYTRPNMAVPGRGGRVDARAMSTAIDKHYPAQADAYLSARRSGATHEEARRHFADAAAASAYKRHYALRRRKDLGLEPLDPRGDLETDQNWKVRSRTHAGVVTRTHSERAEMNAAHPEHADYWAHQKATAAAADVHRHATLVLASTPLLYHGPEHDRLDGTALSAVAAHLHQTGHPLAAAVAATAGHLHRQTTIGDLPHITGPHAAAALDVHNKLHQALRTAVTA